MPNFMDMCLVGQAKITQIDDWVDAWHDDPSPRQTLCEALGLTLDEYKNWIMDSQSITATFFKYKTAYNKKKRA